MAAFMGFRGSGVQIPASRPLQTPQSKELPRTPVETGFPFIEVPEYHNSRPGQSLSSAGRLSSWGRVPEFLNPWRPPGSVSGLSGGRVEA